MREDTFNHTCCVLQTEAKSHDLKLNLIPHLHKTFCRLWTNHTSRHNRSLGYNLVAVEWRNFVCNVYRLRHQLGGGKRHYFERLQNKDDSSEVLTVAPQVENDCYSSYYTRFETIYCLIINLRSYHSVTPPV